MNYRCTKRRHVTLRSALVHLENLKKRNAKVGYAKENADLNCYYCAGCVSYHVGHRTPAYRRTQ